MNKAVVIILVIIVVVLALGGAGLAYYKMTQAAKVVPVVPAAPKVPPPATNTPVAPNQIKLVINSPVDKAIVSTAKIIVSGTTVAGADVSVNDVNIKAGADGKFSALLTLEEGDNPIIVSVFDAEGNFSEQEITVSYYPVTQ